MRRKLGISVLAALTALLSLSGCLGLAPGPCTRETVERLRATEAADSPAMLTCRARGGERDAQYQLARLYDAGEGVAPDAREAARWYKLAAAPSSGQSYYYMAPVGNQSRGWVMPYQTGQPHPGDARAQFALARLYLDGRGVKRSERRARRWLDRAARQGYGPAVILLRELEEGKE